MARLAPTARTSVYADAKSMGEAWKLRKAGEPIPVETVPPQMVKVEVAA